MDTSLFSEALLPYMPNALLDTVVTRKQDRTLERSVTPRDSCFGKSELAPISLPSRFAPHPPPPCPTPPPLPLPLLPPPMLPPRRSSSGTSTRFSIDRFKLERAAAVFELTLSIEDADSPLL